MRAGGSFSKRTTGMNWHSRLWILFFASPYALTNMEHAAITTEVRSSPQPQRFADWETCRAQQCEQYQIRSILGSRPVICKVVCGDRGSMLLVLSDQWQLNGIVIPHGRMDLFPGCGRIHAFSASRQPEIVAGLTGPRPHGPTIYFDGFNCRSRYPFIVSSPKRLLRILVIPCSSRGRHPGDGLARRPISNLHPRLLP